MDGRRRRRRGTPSNPEKNRYVFSGFVPPTSGPRLTCPRREFGDLNFEVGSNLEVEPPVVTVDRTDYGLPYTRM